LAPARVGDALSGLLALAREVLVARPAFVAGLDRLVQALDDADFVLALPALRGAFAWLPARERGELARSLLHLHDAGHLSQRELTGSLRGVAAEALAAASAAEARVVRELAGWGVFGADDGEHGA